MVWGKKECIMLWSLRLQNTMESTFFWFIIQLQNRFRKIKRQHTYWKISFLKNDLGKQDFPENIFLLQSVSLLQTAVTKPLQEAVILFVLGYLHLPVGVFSTEDTAQGKGRHSYSLNCSECVWKCYHQKGGFSTWWCSNSSMFVSKF